MSDKKRSRRRKDEYTGPGGVQKEIEKPSKNEYAVAKWLRKNVRTKKTKFLSHNVEYFTSSKALDALMKSKFGDGENSLFPTREHAIEFLDVMLEHKFFHRAKKVPVFLEELKGKSKKNANEKDTTVQQSKKESAKEEPKATDPDSSHVEGNNTDETQATKEKRKRKIRLDMHPDQVFVDGSEAYVWIYDPVPIHYWIYGMVLVLGAIVICMFPLWPPILRKGVYYLSIFAAGFLVFIFALTIIRLIVFVIVWMLSKGKLYFWIFPNLTEDVGFLASFWPLYEHEYRDGTEKGKGSKKQKKKKKDKDSDAEDDADAHLLEPQRIENIKENETGSVQDSLPDVTKSVPSSKGDEDDDDEDDGEEERVSPTLVKDHIENNGGSGDVKDSTTYSESESEGSRSSTGKDFEMVDPKDVDLS